MNSSISLFLYVAQLSGMVKDELKTEVRYVRSVYMPKPYTAIFSDCETMLYNVEFSFVAMEFLSESPAMIFDGAKKFWVETNFNIPEPANIVIFLDNDNKEEIVGDLRENQIWNARSRTLVIVEKVNLVHEWLAILWEKTRAVDTVVMTLESFDYYTWFPYQEKECTDVITIAKLPKTNLFPQKINKTLNNCTITIVTEEIVPYNILPDKGLEQLLVMTIAQKMNFSRNTIKTPPSDFFWATLRPDGRPGGCLKMLYENSADIAVGSLQMRAEHNRFSEMARSHSEDYLSWFVSVPAFIPSIEKIQRAFPPEIWLYVGVTYVGLVVLATSVIVKLVISEKRSVGDLVLVTMSAYIYTPTLMPNHYLLRFLLVLVFIYSLHITTMYQSGLIFMLSNKVTEVPIRRIEDAIDQDFQFHFYELHRPLINHSDSPIWNEIARKNLYHFRYVPDFDSWLGHSAKKVFIGPLKSAPHYLALQNLIDDEGRIELAALQEPYMGLPIVACAAPGHPILPFVDKFIQMLLEGGICDWWYQQYAEKSVVGFNRENHPLTLVSLGGAFRMYEVAIISCLVVFSLEFIVEYTHSKMLKKMRKLTDRSTY